MWSIAERDRSARDRRPAASAPCVRAKSEEPDPPPPDATWRRHDSSVVTDRADSHRHEKRRPSSSSSSSWSSSWSRWWSPSSSLALRLRRPVGGGEPEAAAASGLTDWDCEAMLPPLIPPSLPGGVADGDAGVAVAGTSVRVGIAADLLFTLQSGLAKPTHGRTASRDTERNTQPTTDGPPRLTTSLFAFWQSRFADFE